MFNTNQWILWVAIPSRKNPGRTNKFPCNPLTGDIADAHDPSIWISYDAAVEAVKRFSGTFGIAFVITEQDPFFFIDIDDGLQADNTWKSEVNDICTWFPGAFVEVSQSGRGLHIIGKYSSIKPHKCNCKSPEFALFTKKRFVAITMLNAQGDAGSDHTSNLNWLVDTFLTGAGADPGAPDEWTCEPVEEWKGPEDDAELIALGFKFNSKKSTFGYKASFEDLWSANSDRLGAFYPDIHGGRAYDESSADAALAQHLAFWTGKNCERIERLMRQSCLVRDKWDDRDDYLYRTILNAVKHQKTVFGSAPALKATSEKQRNLGETNRKNILATATPEQRATLTTKIGAAASARFWIDHNDKTAGELCTLLTPGKIPAHNLNKTVTIVEGLQFMDANEQGGYFRGCVYVQDLHKIFTPTGEILNQDRFNATYGGYLFQLDALGDKTSRKAWDVFTESQVMRFPKVNGTCFRPELQTGSIIDSEGRTLVNVYVPIITPRMQGDPAPFITHLQRVLPNETDQLILLSYMAACVQYKGIKFQWAPLLQGVEGNGKTLFSRCVAFALGHRYTHIPPAQEISEKFNDWLFNKLFIGVEDIYVPDSRREIIEVLKPMITNDRLAMRAMQQSQVMMDNRANFIFNSNHQDAVRKNTRDRRFSVFFTAQQEKEDLAAAGMQGEYFPELYKWLNGNGYAIVSEMLHSFKIPDEYNPAGSCHRAPQTSSTKAALSASLGSVEQHILEAAEEGRTGFRGGWVSSVALEKLLSGMRKNISIAQNKRRELLKSIGYHPHPGLKGGRVNSPILIDDGKKPILFIKTGHPTSALQTPMDILKAYEAAQVG